MTHDERRTLAKKRALRAAAAFTLGLVSATASGCEATADAVCSVFDDTRFCCARTPGGSYDETSGRCIVAPPPFGPLVPPGSIVAPGSISPPGGAA